MDVVVTDRCQGCGACLLTCPEHAFRPGHAGPPGGGPLLVVRALCTGCMECVEVCPADAIDAVDAIDVVETGGGEEGL